MAAWDSSEWKQESWEAADQGEQWAAADQGQGGQEWAAADQKDSWAAGDQAEAPPDPWAQAASGDAGGWADSAWKEENKWLDEYNSHQQYAKDNGTLSRKEEWELEQDDARLFQEGVEAGIDFSLYDSIPVSVSGQKSEQIPVLSTFQEIYDTFGEYIPTALKDNVIRSNYSKPTPVQKYAVPVGLSGRDIMCCAQTGSGKTVAFLIPIIGRMLQYHSNPVCAMQEPFSGKCLPDTLIMAPTRELCLQIYDEACKMCHRTDYKVYRVYGGEKPSVQIPELAKGCDLLIATPGRLQDFINKELIGMERVGMLCLDEADRMLDMGFEKQIRGIVCESGMPDKENRQTMMFSATFPEECQKMAMEFMYDYIWVGVGVVGGAASSVDQQLQLVKSTEKFDALMAHLDDHFGSEERGKKMLVFVNAKDTARWLDEQLYVKKFETGALHGDLDQYKREENLQRFRRGEIEVLIATDVAARGLDIAKVDTVINYDFCTEIDTYVHRIGRSGRIGNRGKAITFISTDDGGSSSYENAATLKELARIMQDAKSEVPDFLSSLIESGTTGAGGGGGGGGWGNDSWSTDVRAKWTKEEGGGGDWSAWESHTSQTAW